MKFVELASRNSRHQVGPQIKINKRRECECLCKHRQTTSAGSSCHCHAQICTCVTAAGPGLFVLKAQAFLRKKPSSSQQLLDNEAVTAAANAAANQIDDALSRAT